jgi:hypothetical protein
MLVATLSPMATYTISTGASHLALTNRHHLFISKCEKIY